MTSVTDSPIVARSCSPTSSGGNIGVGVGVGVEVGRGVGVDVGVGTGNRRERGNRFWRQRRAGIGTALGLILLQLNLVELVIVVIANGAEALRTPGEHDRDAKCEQHSFPTIGVRATRAPTTHSEDINRSGHRRQANQRTGARIPDIRLAGCVPHR